MSNVLKKMQETVNRKEQRYHIGTVIGIKRDRRTVELENGVNRNVWGTSAIGDNVLVYMDQIIGKVGTETMSIVSID